MMHIESFRTYCLNKANVSESFPFDDQVLVFKVAGKIFALANIESFNSFNVKCDPEKAVELREGYTAVEAGYHMSKKHWNTVFVDRDATEQELKEWIDHSYELVYNGLPKKIKTELNWE